MRQHPPWSVPKASCPGRLLSQQHAWWRNPAGSSSGKLQIHAGNDSRLHLGCWGLGQAWEERCDGQCCHLDRLQNQLGDEPLGLPIWGYLDYVIEGWRPSHCGWHRSLAGVSDYINRERELSRAYIHHSLLLDCGYQVINSFKLLLLQVSCSLHDRLAPLNVSQNKDFLWSYFYQSILITETEEETKTTGQVLALRSICHCLYKC